MIQKKALILAALLACPFPAFADTEAPAPVPPPVTQPAPPKRRDITVRQLTPMEFGTFASGPGGGNLTISPSGARLPGGNISVLSMEAAGAADFEVTGQAEEIVTIYLPERVILGGNGGNGDTVIINLTSAPADTLTLDAQGRGRVKVGGTLRIPGNIAPGSYSGNFDIDVRYLR